MARWACDYTPTAEDRILAARSLQDTVAVAVAARDHPLLDRCEPMSEPGRWTVAAHVLDFDDLHMVSTTHISAVCVPAALAVGGDERAYLVAAGVMARLGSLLGWSHYAAGWHATCTAGAPATAVAAAISLRLTPEQTAHAIALSVPAAGGVQRAFGSDGKSLQVAFAVEGGIRAARLAAAGATSDLTVLDAWLDMIGTKPRRPAPDTPAVPEGLAVKIYPCCYALQRPISAIAAAKRGLVATDVVSVRVRTPAATVTPLIHRRPVTGLQGKFSIEYAVAAALLDDHQGFDSFTDAAVCRPEAQRLIECVEVAAEPGGTWLLDGRFEAEIETRDRRVATCVLQFPPGAPERPPTAEQLSVKITDCLRGTALTAADLRWDGAVTTLRQWVGRGRPATTTG